MYSSSKKEGRSFCQPIRTWIHLNYLSNKTRIIKCSTQGTEFVKSILHPFSRCNISLKYKKHLPGLTKIHHRMAAILLAVIGFFYAPGDEGLSQLEPFVHPQ